MLPISDKDRRIALLVILNVVLAATLGTAGDLRSAACFCILTPLERGNVDIFSW